jgi:propanol-preferring alcohol dehydrogenase
MRSMVLSQAKHPLELRYLPIPKPLETQVLIQVKACGVCRTDLHIFDGELEQPKLPLIMGHQIVGIVRQTGSKVQQFQVGQRVGVPWLGKTCGHCPYCQQNRENLCDEAKFTGYNLDGGYAEYTVADAQFCFPLADNFSDLQAAPLLCAGLIGYRSYKMTGAAEKIGFYGFGAAAHVLIQVANYFGKRIYAFTRQGDWRSQQFAQELGAVWAGDSTTSPPEPLDAAIIFAPVGALVPIALKSVVKGGIVVCAGIHMSDIPSFPYRLLWEERLLRSVANLTRQDGEEFLALAPKIPIQTQVNPFPLEQANEALEALRQGQIDGSVVLTL